MITALPSLDDSAGWSKAHYIIKGTLGSGPLPGRDSTYPTPHLINQAFISDAAIVGVIDQEMPSHLTANNAFLYTPFHVYVQEVLFDKEKRLIQGRDLTVVRLGGQIALSGVTVIAADAGFAWATCRGNIYFLSAPSGWYYSVPHLPWGLFQTVTKCDGHFRSVEFRLSKNNLVWRSSQFFD